jgi:HEAT repeats/Type VI secretion system VasI, EvfG, VC_A0118
MFASLVVLALALPAAPATEPAKQKPTPVTGGWTISKSVSKMDDSQTVVLRLQARSPISGWLAKSVTPALLLRCQEGDVSAFVNVGMHASVEAGNLEAATVTIRYDKNEAQDFSMGHSTDGEALFFGNAKDAILQMLAHQSMLFRFTPFNSSPQETSFNLRGLRAVIKHLETACDWDPDQEARDAEKQAKDAEALEPELIKERTARLLDQSLPENRRLLAANDLGHMGTPNVRLAVPALIQALSDPNDHVRMVAAEALGNIGPAAAEAVPTLVALAKGPADNVATFARRALDKIRR